MNKRAVQTQKRLTDFWKYSVLVFLTVIHHLIRFTFFDLIRKYVMHYFTVRNCAHKKAVTVLLCRSLWTCLSTSTINKRPNQSKHSLLFWKRLLNEYSVKTVLFFIKIIIVKKKIAPISFKSKLTLYICIMCWINC